MNLPIDILFGQKGDPPAYPFEYIQDLQWKMTDILTATRQTLQVTQVRHKMEYDILIFTSF